MRTVSKSTPASSDTPKRGPTADRILAGATELFFHQGYPQTSVREITAASGLTSGTLYNHFRSKEELLYEILRRTHEKTDADLERALARAGEDPARQLRELVIESTRFHTTHRMEGTVSRSEWKRLPPEQAQQMLSSQRRTRRTYERTIQRGIDAGVFRLELPDGRPVDVSITAKAILDFSIHAGTWFRPEAGLSDAELAEQHAVLALQMVGYDVRGG